MTKISDIITKEAKAEFKYFRDNNLWYEINGFSFPVPIDDVGVATFNRTDKAIFFMRWVRKFLKEIENEEN